MKVKKGISNSLLMLKILTGLSVFISVFGVYNYITNISQNAFSVCELVICFYCFVSILLKDQIAENTLKESSSEEKDKAATEE